MKMILDVTDSIDYIPALNAGQMVMAQHPNQEIGNKGAIAVNDRGKNFMVIRNMDSYTVRRMS
jgi:formate-dependent nitrite reductase cytochrome c552 subunit